LASNAWRIGDGSDEDRKKFVEQVRKACRIASELRKLGARPYGVVRIDSASSVEDWTKDAEASLHAYRFVRGTVREAFGHPQVS